MPGGGGGASRCQPSTARAAVTGQQREPREVVILFGRGRHGPSPRGHRPAPGPPPARLAVPFTQTPSDASSFSRQEGDRRVKLQNMVTFPLTGLDMTPHVVKRSQSSWSLPSHWSPWRRPYGLGRDPEDCVYDLYAVCNHRGTMHGGHYTGPQRGGPRTCRPAPAPGGGAGCSLLRRSRRGHGPTRGAACRQQPGPLGPRPARLPRGPGFSRVRGDSGTLCGVLTVPREGFSFLCEG